MSINTAGISKATLNLIKRFGKSVTFTAVTEGTYDIATASTVNTKVVTILKAIVEDWPISRSRAQNLVSGLIQIGDKVITIAAESLTIKPNAADKFKIDNEEFAIIENGVQTVFLAEIPVIYICAGRKA